MNHDPLQRESPDRLYTVTGGRGDTDTRTLDSVTLIVSECEPVPGMQSEHAAILRMCVFPTAVVEVSAELGLPVSVVRILLLDLLDTGRVAARHPASSVQRAEGHDPETLKQVLLALQRL
ncbi:DUF742 domain-containing protein [Nocardiopsis quinghaiensis]|uniref:DUF742 domain-containing protein n=1 Tax=Nocardiopsis quinghaiensis TaxID=464995 RepID=UPI00123BCFBE|nr:DUF742 domain-containing protein [Nocardiopsis quinghaiensis]